MSPSAKPTLPEGHACEPTKDANLWRAVCSCGWCSRLCMSKSAAEKAVWYHPGLERTVTSKRSRMPYGARYLHDAKIEGWRKWKR